MGGGSLSSQLLLGLLRSSIKFSTIVAAAPNRPLMTTVTMKKPKKRQRETAGVPKQRELVVNLAMKMLKTRELKAQMEQPRLINAISTKRRRRPEAKTSSLRQTADAQLPRINLLPKLPFQVKITRIVKHLQTLGL